MESVKKRRFTIKSSSTLSMREKISTLKNIFGLSLTFSFVISFFWHTFFFYSIHSVPTGSEDFFTWALLSISVTGLYLLALFFLLVSYPHIIISQVEVHEKRIINFIIMMLVRIFPYFILYAMVSEVSVPKIAASFFLYTVIVIILITFIRSIRKHLFNIILYIFLGFVVCVTIAYIFSPTTSAKYTWLILITIYLFQVFHHGLKEFGKYNKQYITPAILFNMFLIFFIVFPNLIPNYRFDRIVLVAPYSLFNAGYYTSDIYVNKEAYNEYNKIKFGTTPALNSNNDSYEIENAFILFSMGNEYIIKVKDEEDTDYNTKHVNSLNGKLKYKRFIMKAYRNKDTLPSIYSYEYTDWPQNK